MYPELERMVAEGELKVERSSPPHVSNDGSIWTAYYKAASDVLYGRRRYLDGNYDWYMFS
jgi:hypothetical protein